MPVVASKSKSLKPSPSERIEARVPRALKQTLEKAAAVTGHPTLTSYVVHTLQSNAEAVIEQYERTRLSAEDSRAFVDSLLRPGAPNQALKAALRRYRVASAG